jgi:anaerobic selenocysteine-containing dehydrogenase
VKRPRGFRNYIDILHDPDFALPQEVAERTLGADQFPLWAGPKGWQTSAHNPTVLDAILTGNPHPVRAMHVSGVNIAVTYPDTQKVMAALKSLDFLSVASHMMTPTSELADIVLPKTTGLEEEEVSWSPRHTLSATPTRLSSRRTKRDRILTSPPTSRGGLRPGESIRGNISRGRANGNSTNTCSETKSTGMRLKKTGGRRSNSNSKILLRRGLKHHQKR